MQTIDAPNALESKLGRLVGAGSKSDWPSFALLALACALLFFLALGSWGFIDPGDGYFSEAAREMMERGDYIVPHLNYQIYFSKPILIYWLIISAYKTFGINEFAARFWSAALATAAVFCTYWMTRRIAGVRAGLLAGIALAASPLVITFARMSLIDMGFASLLGIAMCASVMTLCTESRRWWPWIYAMLGLAVLDKGPAAVVIYGAAMLFYFVVSKPDRATIKDIFSRLHLLPGALIFTAIAVPWYVAVGAATNGLWPQVFFLFENVGRFTGHTNHRVPYPWFYLPVVAYGFFPWALFLPAALMAPVQDAWRRWRSGATIARLGRESAELLLTCWALGVILFFSLSQTKLQTYVLPAWPAMAALVGILMDRFITLAQTGYKTKYVLRCGWILALAGAVSIIASIAGAAFACNPSLLPAINAKWGLRAADAVSAIGLDLRLSIVATAAVAGVGLVWSGWHYCKYVVDKATLALCLTAVLAGTIGGISFYHVGYRFKNEDAHRVVALAGLKHKAGAVALFRDFKPSLVYHLERPVDTFFSVDQLRPRASFPNAPETQYIIAGPKGASELMASYPSALKVEAQSGDWYVLSSHELVALRLPTLEQSFTQHIDLGGGEFSWGTLPLAGGTKTTH